MTAVAAEGDGPAEAPLPAAGSNFYTAMRILPRAQREGMYAVYAFCRAVDDIADDDGPKEGRRAALDGWRHDIDALYVGGDPGLARDLAPHVRRFGLKREDFQAVIDGMAMDLDGPIRAPDWETLDLYCDRVASAVGRLSSRIFGLDEQAGRDLAHHLGRALQLTNILRDIDEDAAIGRLYLPREGLLAAGIDPDGRSPQSVIDDPAIEAVCAGVAAHASAHFREAGRIMAAAPRAAVRAPRLMEAAYGQILERLLARGFAPPRAPVRISKPRLLIAALRYGLF